MLSSTCIDKTTDLVRIWHQMASSNIVIYIYISMHPGKLCHLIPWNVPPWRKPCGWLDVKYQVTKSFKLVLSTSYRLTPALCLGLCCNLSVCRIDIPQMHPFTLTRPVTLAFEWVMFKSHSLTCSQSEVTTTKKQTKYTARFAHFGRLFFSVPHNGSTAYSRMNN